jgi:hypothetical protein
MMIGSAEISGTGTTGGLLPLPKPLPFIAATSAATVEAAASISS